MIIANLIVISCIRVVAPILIAITIATGFNVQFLAAENQPVAASFQVTISGFGENEPIKILLGTQGDSLQIKTELYTWEATGTGKDVVKTLQFELEDGYYLIELEAPANYFRNPRGYTFRVENSSIINPSSRNLLDFELIRKPDQLDIESIIPVSAPYKSPISLPSLPLWQRLMLPISIATGSIIFLTIALLVWKQYRKHAKFQM